MSAGAIAPDGRPSELYEVKGTGKMRAQILVDAKTMIIYSAIAPVLSLHGWPLEKLQTWISDKQGWALTYLGDGTKVTTLKSIL